jgi:hypothetical protein
MISSYSFFFFLKGDAIKKIPLKLLLIFLKERIIDNFYVLIYISFLCEHKYLLKKDSIYFLKKYKILTIQKTLYESHKFS